MFASINWLKDYVKIDTDVRTYTDAMTLTGTKVEGYEYRAKDISNIVTAKVNDIYPHPDSDHMFVCSVDDGEKVSQVVTGAQNVTKGDIVPFARDNSVVCGGKEIKTSKLRGVLSEGMLCSAEEIGIDPSCTPKHAQNGIYILPQDTPLGIDIKDYFELDDYVVEFELTNNRQDCNSILGIACETSATFGAEFIYPDYYLSTQGEEIKKYLSVEVKDKALCKRYTARMVKVKEIAPSPMWIQNRLISAGVRPINNIVDVSNFVMLEIGQPLHTFDYDKLAKGTIIVDTASANDSIVTLDGTKRNLDENMLMINDAERHVAIAGIMGALNSDIDSNTKTVVIESANFDKNTIRSTQKRLGLRSESSAHFEKGISEHLTRYAADRAVALMVEIGAAEAIEGIIDIYEKLPETKELSINIDWYNKFTGISITPDEACSLLNRLGFKAVTEGCDNVKITVPKFRSDINCEEDIAEEITRMYGYEKIPMSMPASTYIALPNREYVFQNKIKNILIGAGATETLTYTFISPQAIAALGLEKDDIRNTPELLINAYGEDYSAMRTTLICNLVDSLAANSNRKNADTLLFEIANVYFKRSTTDELPKQPKKICFGKVNCDFYELKTVMQCLLSALKITDVKYIRANETFLHPGRSAYVLLNGKAVGFIGQLHPRYANSVEINENTSVAEIDFAALYEEAEKSELKYKSSSRFPAVTRDLALVMDEEVLSGSVEEHIMKNGGDDIISCVPFDVYRNEALGVGKKSIAYSITFRNEEHTLVDETVNANIENILNTLESDMNIEIRK